MTTIERLGILLVPQSTTRRIIRNYGWNILGQTLPFLVGIVSIPLLIHRLGADRYGILSLGWLVIGYFSLFDLGLGRALTFMIGATLGDDPEKVQPIFWTGLCMLLGLSIPAMIVGYGICPLVVRQGLKIPAQYQAETLAAFHLLAFSLPFDISGAGLRGALEAHQRFRASSAVSMCMGILTYVAPLLVLPFTHSLVWIIFALLVVRVIVWIALFICCLDNFSSGLHLRFDVSTARPLLRVSSWMLVSNVISPLMDTIDRVALGAFLSVAAVTYYTTPYYMATKLLIIPTALAGVLFPTFAKDLMRRRGEATSLYGQAYRSCFLVLFPLTFCLFLFAPNLLNLWLGAEFAQRSAPVLRWIAIGVLANGLAQIPFALIQGDGRPDVTAKLHLFELPLYVGLLIALVRPLGITGVAIAWSTRVVIDWLLLSVCAARMIGGRLLWFAGAVIMVTVAVFLIGLFPATVASKAVYMATVLVLFLAYVTWAYGRVVRASSVYGSDCADA